MAVKVGCSVTLRYGERNEIWQVAAEHYESLRDSLDRGDTGWIELDSAWPGGKVFVKLENIVDLFLATPEFADARDAWDRQEKLAGTD